MKWITSGGGPLILLDEEYLREWNGATSVWECDVESGKAKEHESPDDYERACLINEIVGTIKVGAGVGVVLGDAPLPTAWHPLEDKEGGLIIRWKYADSEDSVWQNIPILLSEPFNKPDFTFYIPSGRLFLFDSGCPGTDPDCLETSCLEEMLLIKGHYQIATIAFKPDERTSLIVHKISRLKSWL